MKYIFVDDDEFSNWVYSLVVTEAVGEADIKTFTEPGEALKFLPKHYESIEEATILFLDINMPRTNGWEFLVLYEQFSEEVKKQINIYMLSSSCDDRDRKKAEDNKNVKGFISKPLTAETIISIAGKEFLN